MRRAGLLALLPLGLLPLAGTAADAAVTRLARQPAVKAALQTLREDDERTLREQIAIAQIPSPPYQETVRAQDFAARLRAAGLTDVSIDATGNVIGKRKGAGRGPLLVVSAHLDSVFPEGSDVTVKESNGRYSGMGVVDDARGLAAVLSVLRAMEGAKLRTVGDVWFVGTVGEEALGNLRGVKALFADNPGIDGFISVDGAESADEVRSGNRGIVTQATGSRRWEFTFTGPGGHSFGNFGNPSAVHALGRAVARIADLSTPADPKTTFNVGVISGGTGVTAIAAQASMQVDLRSNSADELRSVEDRLQTIVTEAVAAENARWHSSAVTVERKLVGDRPASTQMGDHRVADAATGAYLALGLPAPRLDFASTDSNVPLGLGIPAATLNGGGIGDKAHSPDEWYEPVEAWQGPQILLLTALRLVGVPGQARPTLVDR
ncbi:MAG TPA: M20/M25/M40 family metallo-hydrolase [Steroidobacteraceae bacterium]|nr:M20/M25/M40 family metallo-hydrolase [Steroidobacteraceae bacterium]